MPSTEDTSLAVILNLFDSKNQEEEKLIKDRSKFDGSLISA